MQTDYIGRVAKNVITRVKERGRGERVLSRPRRMKKF
jgi:hypothetical protein